MDSAGVLGHVAVVAEAQRAHTNNKGGKKNFDWNLCRSRLVEQVYVLKADITTSQSFKLKYQQIIANLWMDREFADQGGALGWNAVQDAFRKIQSDFAKTMGFGDEQRVNHSALPSEDDLSDTNKFLLAMYRRGKIELEAKKSKKSGDIQKRIVKEGIVDALKSGGSNQILNLAQNAAKVKMDKDTPAIVQNFAKGFGNPTITPHEEEETDDDDASVQVVTAIKGEGEKRKERKLIRRERNKRNKINEDHDNDAFSTLMTSIMKDSEEQQASVLKHNLDTLLLESKEETFLQIVLEFLVLLPF
jgi:hypothetical protein